MLNSAETMLNSNVFLKSEVKMMIIFAFLFFICDIIVLKRIFRLVYFLTGRLCDLNFIDTWKVETCKASFNPKVRLDFVI